MVCFAVLKSVFVGLCCRRKAKVQQEAVVEVAEVPEEEEVVVEGEVVHGVLEEDEVDEIKVSELV